MGADMMANLGLLLVSHSTRPVEPGRCDQGFLKRRYASPQRLSNLPPFESLPSVDSFNVRYGAISLFRVVKGREGIRLVHMSRCTMVHKVQHALALGDRQLLLCFEDHLALFRTDDSLMRMRGNINRRMTRVKTFRHPLFAGLHNTVSIDGARVAISASAPDAVLILNIVSGEIEQMLRMPEERYGCNYPIDLDTDVNSHYISNDLQTTHVNTVSVDSSGGLLVTALIPGAVGRFDRRSGDYTEITKGFVGCHGARGLADGGSYFADSSNGRLVFIDSDGGVSAQIELGCCWLHDVQLLGNGLFACAVADRNAIVVVDVEQGVVVTEHKFRNCLNDRWQKFCHRYTGWLGNSLQFFSFHPELSNAGN